MKHCTLSGFRVSVNKSTGESGGIRTYDQGANFIEHTAQYRSLYISSKMACNFIVRKSMQYDVWQNIVVLRTYHGIPIPYRFLAWISETSVKYGGKCPSPEFTIGAWLYASQRKILIHWNHRWMTVNLEKCWLKIFTTINHTLDVDAVKQIWWICLQPWK